MSDHDKEIDAHSGTETTGHEWDGIKELNTPLPRWWLIVWYASIIIAVVYMVLMPAIPGLPGMKGATPGLLGYSDRDAVGEEMTLLRAERAVTGNRLLAASLQEIENDPELLQFARVAGESAFGDNCATCHGRGGAGAKGYPVLADNVWLWGGTLEDIEYTITHGIRNQNPDSRFSLMPYFGRDGILKPAEIEDLVQYVTTLSGREADLAAAGRGQVLFAAQCVSCHGEDGKGMRSVGSPDLTDADWLYGGSEREIYESIYNPRNSMMPVWSERLDEATIKALAVYVYNLGGGEEG